MNTPICDFINEYAKEENLRFHMPGHKGKSQLGFEKYDITEIVGADSLYHADGIIKESEANATALFGSGKTLYSTEGSSHVIRAMLYLAKMYGGQKDCYVLAGRNAHSSFISACVLNDIDIEWLYPLNGESYLSCTITAEHLENALRSVDKAPVCVYVTSPDYLGNMCDTSSLANVCKKYGTMLVVDNAHGAYLKFLKNDVHPISLGATMCCDSAHKTLPVLTGGAYLHISKDAPSFFEENAKQALSLFGSTSPSYLTLASLDNANKYISNGFCERLNSFVDKLSNLASDFTFCILNSEHSLREPLKITIEPKKMGYTGEELAKILQDKGIVCEFFDEDYLVLMPSLENGIDETERLFNTLNGIEIKPPVMPTQTKLIPPKKTMTVREAIYSPRQTVSIDNALGRTLATSSVSCPPAVSVIVCGEKFNESTVELCKKYGFNTVEVIKK